MATLEKLVCGDSYILEVNVWEDQEQTIPVDLSSIKHAEYNIWTTSDFEDPLLTAIWKESPYLTIPNPLEGKIIVDLRGDKRSVKSGQLFHCLHIIDESGRKTTVLSENINLTILPHQK